MIVIAFLLVQICRSVLDVLVELGCVLLEGSIKFELVVTSASAWSCLGAGGKSCNNKCFGVHFRYFEIESVYEIDFFG